jgi:hypothetical protein
MQESTRVDLPHIQDPVRSFFPVLILGIIAIISPFAVLIQNAVPPSDPPPLGWDSSVRIYLWAAWFSIGFIQEGYTLGGGITHIYALPFVIMTLIYCLFQISVCAGRIQAKQGLVAEIIIFLIWIFLCQAIYGTTQDWTLIQTPLLPIAGISILLYAYKKERR